MKKTSLLSCMMLTCYVSGCTPIQRHQALVSVGAAGCGTGIAAEAAGEDWGALVRAAGCWLADWAAERLDRLKEAERMAEKTRQAAEDAEMRQELIDEAALELAKARARLIAEPCPEHAEEVEEALEDCRKIQQREAQSLR